MSRSFFELSEFKSRHQRVRSEMARRGIDVLLVTSPININYLIGSAAKSYQTFQCLVFPLNEAEPVAMFLRLSDVAEIRDISLADDVQGFGGRKLEEPVQAFVQFIASRGLINKRLGLETPPYYLSVGNYRKLINLLPEDSVVDATDLVESLKLVKSPAEIAYIRRAAEIADIGMDAMLESIAAGQSERQVAAEAHYAMYMAGGDSPASPMNFVSGERTCYAHGAPTDRVLRDGDFIHVEYGGAYRRYTSTLARHIAIGKPSERARTLHDVTRAACDACIAAIRDGVSAETPHLAAVEVIREAGLEEFNLHLAGYGVGPGFPPAWGESFKMFFGSTAPLKSGMVVSIEPPIFIHDEGLGARLIDCVIVQEKGAEILSRCSRDLFVI